MNPLLGRPGVSATRTAAYGEVFLWADDALFLPGGGVIDGTKARDYGNAANLFLLRPGLLMGLITSSKKWAPSIVGVTTGAYTSGGTSIAVSAAQGVEIVRRVGATGNLYYVGPPAAAGVVATTGPIAYSAVAANGTITTASLGVNKAAGTLVVVGDGSELPRSIIPGSYGVEVPTDSTDVDFPRVPMVGVLDVTKIIDYPTDASLKQWLKDTIAANARGRWTFSDELS